MFVVPSTNIAHHCTNHLMEGVAEIPKNYLILIMFYVVIKEYFETR